MKFISSEDKSISLIDGNDTIEVLCASKGVQVVRHSLTSKGKPISHKKQFTWAEALALLEGQTILPLKP